METIHYLTEGTCSSEIIVQIEDNKIQNVQFIGGCQGNLRGISNLVKGMDINDVIIRLQSITCGSKPTSCPDQLARCLVNYLKSKNIELKTNV